MILVFVNRSKFESIPLPRNLDLVIGVALIPSSFAFNWLFGSVTGDWAYGLTDYTILVVGIFAFYYPISEKIVQLGLVLLILLRLLTIGLSHVYSSGFVVVSDFIVGIVVAFSKILISSDITSGMIPGEIFVGGAAGSTPIFIGWACVGLEELVLISVILYILIDSFHLHRTATILWFAIGVIGSFLVNILRMVILIWVAFSRGIGDMLWVHTHIGDVLFLVWIAIFWWIFLGFASRGRRIDKASSLEERDSLVE